MRAVTASALPPPYLQVSRKKLVLEHLVVRKMGDAGGSGKAGQALKQSELDDILRCVLFA